MSWEVVEVAGMKRFAFLRNSFGKQSGEKKSGEKNSGEKNSGEKNSGEKNSGKDFFFFLGGPSVEIYELCFVVCIECLIVCAAGKQISLL